MVISVSVQYCPFTFAIIHLYATNKLQCKANTKVTPHLENVCILGY
jgi:hypothetical protein